MPYLFKFCSARLHVITFPSLITPPPVERCTPPTPCMRGPWRIKVQISRALVPNACSIMSSNSTRNCANFGRWRRFSCMTAVVIVVVELVIWYGARAQSCRPSSGNVIVVGPRASCNTAWALVRGHRRGNKMHPDQLHMYALHMYAQPYNKKCQR